MPEYIDESQLDPIDSGGLRYITEADLDPIDTQPTWGQSARAVGKMGLEGLAKMVGIAVDYGTPLSHFRNALPSDMAESLKFGPKIQELLNSNNLNPESEGITGPAFDFSKAAVESAVFPASGPGGVLLNALSGIGGEVAHKAFPESAIAPVIGSIASVAPIAAAESGIKYAASKAPELARSWRAVTLGVTPSDVVRSAKNQYVSASGGTQIEKAMAQLEKEGVLEGSLDIKDVWARHQQGANAIGKELKSVLAKADANLGDTSVIPKFKRAEAYIKNDAVADDVDGLTKQLEDFKEAIRTKGNGTLNYLQKQKELLYDKAYPEGSAAREGLDAAMAGDIKDTIEKAVDALTPESAGAVKELNSRLGAFEQLQPILKRSIGKDAGTRWFDKVRAFIRTSGGFGTWGLGGAYIGGLPGAAIGAGAAYGLNKIATPEGERSLIRALTSIEGASNRLAGAGDVLGRGAGVGISQLASNPQVSPLLQALSSQQPQATTADQAKGNAQAGQQSRIASSRLFRSESQPSSKPTPAAAATQADINGLISGLPPLLRGMVAVESNKNPAAVSPKGARGLMQVMPFHYKRLGVTDPNDPIQSIKAGSTIINEEYKRFGDIQLALAAYNAGSPAVIDAMQRARSKDWEQIKKYLPKETQNYVPAVLAQSAKFMG